MFPHAIQCRRSVCWSVVDSLMKVNNVHVFSFVFIAFMTTETLTGLINIVSLEMFFERVELRTNLGATTIVGTWIPLACRTKYK